MSISCEQAAEQRQRQPEHRGVVAVDPVDERRGVAVDREAAGDGQRLAGGEVGVHLAVGGAPVVHDVEATPPRPRSVAVSSTQSPECSVADRPATDAHQARATSSDGRLAARLAVDVEHRVAAEHDGRLAVEPVGHHAGLALGEGLGDLGGGAGDVVLRQRRSRSPRERSPASRSTRARTGDAEASTRRRVTPPGWSAMALSGAVGSIRLVGLARGDELRMDVRQRDPPSGSVECDVDALTVEPEDADEHGHERRRPPTARAGAPANRRRRRFVPPTSSNSHHGPPSEEGERRAIAQRSARLRIRS